ncbi:MAG: hypothetical protein NC299_16870 [Lachnospiraceae bacterium]|nr:hypothetical protein [Ruminococcus sp.]MCM1277004.1 hypothetical protein [Lachnospiraceae bacterium]
MARLLDIDLLLPKIVKLKNNCNNTNVFSIGQVLWILEQEFALQNGTTNDMPLKSQNDSRNQSVEIMDDIVRQSVKVCDCQSELLEIKTTK